MPTTNFIRTLIFCVATMLAILASGCGLQEVRRQSAAVENTGILKGKVVVRSKQKGPVVVMRFEDKSGIFTLEQQQIVTNSGEFEFGVAPGDYLVAAFIDTNRDGEFQRGVEHGNFHTDPLTVSVEARQVVEVKPIVISDHPPLPPEGREVEVDKAAIFENIGKVVSLGDAQFNRDNYSLGLWRPVDFLNDVGGGFFFLHEYDSAKIPVLFVHGIGGGPTDLRRLIESLDAQRFQAWVLYYPSGLRLDMISDYTVEAVTALQNRYDFHEINVVAHSMGGLVVRSFVKKYVERFPDRTRDIRLVITINSPMAGMVSAARGVAHSPVVVPSWRDVASNSDFLRKLHAWPWPEAIPYYLVFSYEEGSGDDGVVALESQIPIKLQSEAVRMYGFENSHVGTLNDDAFIEVFGRILDTNVDRAGDRSVTADR